MDREVARNGSGKASTASKRKMLEKVLAQRSSNPHLVGSLRIPSIFVLPLKPNSFESENAFVVDNRRVQAGLVLLELLALGFYPSSLRQKQPHLEMRLLKTCKSGLYVAHSTSSS